MFWMALGYEDVRVEYKYVVVGPMPKKRSLKIESGSV